MYLVTLKLWPGPLASLEECQALHAPGQGGLRVRHSVCERLLPQSWTIRGPRLLWQCQEGQRGSRSGLVGAMIFSCTRLGRHTWGLHPAAG